ncbi:MAG: hypothetical protein AAGC71_09820 [Pseudomonadota bacterium]
MSDNDDTRIKALFDAAPPPDADPEHDPLDRVMPRVRAGVGQRDTLLFAIVRIWTAIAEMLAPVFAQLGERRAETAARARLGQLRRSDDNPPPTTDKNP